jgi:hypothetical protein
MQRWCHALQKLIGGTTQDLGERALKAGGEVVVVPAERMPRRTGAAAIYRF